MCPGLVGNLDRSVLYRVQVLGGHPGDGFVRVPCGAERKVAARPLRHLPFTGTSRSSFHFLHGSPAQTLQISAANLDRGNGLLAQEAANNRTVKVKVAKVATTAEKSKYRYSDFYCFMSLADFTAYVSRDDRDGDSGFSISGSEPAA